MLDLCVFLGIENYGVRHSECCSCLKDSTFPPKFRRLRVDTAYVHRFCQIILLLPSGQQPRANIFYRQGGRHGYYFCSKTPGCIDHDVAVQSFKPVRGHIVPCHV